MAATPWVSHDTLGTVQQGLVIVLIENGLLNHIVITDITTAIEITVVAVVIALSPDRLFEPHALSETNDEFQNIINVTITSLATAVTINMNIMDVNVLIVFNEMTLVIADIVFNATILVDLRGLVVRHADHGVR
jgi:hypothetical protein